MRKSMYGLLGLAGLLLGVLSCRAPLPPPPTETPLPPETAAPSEPPAPTGTAVPTLTPVLPTGTSPPPATSTPTRTPPPTPLPPTEPPPPSPTPSGPAVIHTFRARAADGAELEVADPGDTITLEWSWSGGTEATIYHMFGLQLSEPYWNVGPSGSLDYTISPQARNIERFALFVNDAQGLAAQETLEIELHCPDTWFFEPAPDVCPADAAVVSDGAEQHFERGVMIWVGAEDRIYVLFADGQSPAWQAYEDHFDEGEDPESDPTIEPPVGRYQPIRGFGMVWREESGVRERVGWAVDAEGGYPAAVQRTSYIKYNSTYIRALDGGVWHLGPEHSAWEYLPPQ